MEPSGRRSNIGPARREDPPMPRLRDTQRRRRIRREAHRWHRCADRVIARQRRRSRVSARSTGTRRIRGS